MKGTNGFRKIYNRTKVTSTYYIVPPGFCGQKLLRLRPINKLRPKSVNIAIISRSF